jgi:GST-like protein
MSDTHHDAHGYTPPTIWTWTPGHGGRFANINRPIAGPTHEQALPVGKHPLQLYSLGTPNGVKVTVMLEELLAAGHTGAEYDAWLIRIHEGAQFGSGFVEVNPNSKIPALMDRSGPEPIRVFESGAILHVPGRKVRRLPAHGPGPARRVPVVVVLADGQCAVPGRRLRSLLCLCPGQARIRHRPLSPWRSSARWTCSTAAWPSTLHGGRRVHHCRHGHLALVRALAKGQLYEAGEFLQVQDYVHVVRWADEIAQRPAVRRGRMVNRVMGDPASQLHERHDASDFDTQTQDKLACP